MSAPVPSSITGPVCLTLGVLFGIGTVFAYVWQRRFLRRALPATGVVQSLRAETLQRSTLYFPVIQFTTAAGVTVTAESHTSQSGISVGQKVPILYDPDNPQNLEINSLLSRWVLVGLTASLALVLLVIGGAALAAR